MRWIGWSTLFAFLGLLLFIGGVITLTLASTNHDAVPILVYVGLVVVAPAVAAAMSRPAEPMDWAKRWVVGSLLGHLFLVPVGIAFSAL